MFGRRRRRRLRRRPARRRGAAGWRRAAAAACGGGTRGGGWRGGGGEPLLQVEELSIGERQIVDMPEVTRLVAAGRVRRMRERRAAHPAALLIGELRQAEQVVRQVAVGDAAQIVVALFRAADLDV